MKHIALKQLAREQSGSVLMLVGVSMLVLFAAAGAGYDLGRLDLVTQKLQQASDAAALAGASLPSTATSTDRQNEGLRYFNLNYPATYLGVARPTATVTVSSSSVTVSAQAPMGTSFVGNVGITSMTAAGNSVVGLSASATSDYDVVMIVDESGSEIALSPPYISREEAQKAALTTMANTILPVGVTNPNVRMGFVGFSGYISNKWGLSSNNADAMTAISRLVPRDQNFDHVALLTAKNMLLGGQGALNATTNLPLGTVAFNTTTPKPRTLRTNAVDGNGIAPTKFVVFLSDGGIMLEPDDIGDFNQDLSGLVHAKCPGRLGYPAPECFAAFSDACTQVKNLNGITDNVHVFIINLNNPVTSGELTTLTGCASTTVTGAPTYPTSEQPDPTKDFYFASDATVLASILKNITTVIQKVRITQ